jgi:hypothetical protein
MRPLSSGLGNGIYMKLRKTLNNSSKKNFEQTKNGFIPILSLKYKKFSLVQCTRHLCASK